VEVLPDSFEEERTALIVSLDFLGVLHVGSDLVLYFVLVFGKHQIRNLTSVQDIVQVLHEGFLQNLGVSHCESDWLALDTGHEHEFLNEVSELNDAVTLHDFNLLELHIVNVGTEFDERLLT
jgi:hypothetical protein